MKLGDQKVGAPGKSRVADQHVSLSELAYETIRSWIVSGRVKPGERLVAATVAEELGMSPMPVRDALRLLEEHGFVEIFPRRGAVVAAPTVRDVMDVYDVRVSLERLSARLAARRRTDADVDRLRDLALRGRKATRNRQWKQASELNWAFHETLAEASDNHQLLDLLPIFRHKLAWMDGTSAQQRGLQAWDEHDAIVDAVEAGDEEKAEALAVSHTGASREMYLARFDDVEVPAQRFVSPDLDD